MLTFGYRDLTLGGSHGTRTLAPTLSPGHGGGTNPPPDRCHLPAPHHRLGVPLGGPARPAGELGLRREELGHDHFATRDSARPVDPQSAAPPGGHRDADAGPGAAGARKETRNSSP